MLTLLTVIGFILLLAGIAGCILPVIPGPPLSFAALVILEVATKGEAFTNHQLIFWAVIATLVTLLDYVIPAAGAKKYGASKWGVWGSIIGLIVGMLFFGPFGMFIGTFAGAVTGEMIVGKSSGAALKAGFGTFIGTMLGIGIKLTASLVMAYYFIRAVIS